MTRDLEGIEKPVIKAEKQWEPRRTALSACSTPGEGGEGERKIKEALPKELFFPHVSAEHQMS